MPPRDHIKASVMTGCAEHMSAWMRECVIVSVCLCAPFCQCYKMALLTICFSVWTNAQHITHSKGTQWTHETFNLAWTLVFSHSNSADNLKMAKRSNSADSKWTWLQKTHPPAVQTFHLWWAANQLSVGLMWRQAKTACYSRGWTWGLPQAPV